jgi:hypothetical protein
MANIKVSDMTALTSLPDGAIFYVVLPDGSYGSVTKLELLSGIVGTSQLVDLTDVQIVSLVNGQALVWDSVDSKWKNKTVALLSDLTAVLEGIAWKQPVELNLDSGVTLSGSIPTITSLTQQGVTLVNDSRVIVSGLANQIFNGIYRVNSTLVSGTYRLYRTNDANTTAELNNAVVGVTGGTHAGKTFRQSTLNPVIGTSNIVFQDFGNTVANATDVISGISKLYNAIGTETDGGITPNAVKDALDLKANKTDIEPLVKRRYFDDLQGLGPGGFNGIFLTSNSFVLEGNINIMKLGSGAVWTRVASELGHSGVIRGGTGFAATNGNYLQFRSIWMGTEDFIIESSTRLQQLSSASQRFTNSLSYGSTNNIIQLSYADNVNGGKWFCECTNASITSSVDSGVNVAINTWYNLKIVRISMVCYFYVNNVLVGTISTNVPSGVDAVCQQGLLKLIGTTSVTADFDYLKMFDL